MTKVLELVQNILEYCKEGKAAEIINLIKNTPLTNEELKKINDVVFDVILSNTSKGAENGKRTEAQRN